MNETVVLASGSAPAPTPAPTPAASASNATKQAEPNPLPSRQDATLESNIQGNGEIWASGQIDGEKLRSGQRDQ